MTTNDQTEGLDVQVTEDQDEQYEIEYEVSDEPQTEAEPEAQENPWEAQMAELRAQNQQLMTQVSGLGSQQALVDGLKEVLGQREPQKPTTVDQKSFEDELSAIKDELLDNPDKALKKYSQLLIKHEIAPVVGMLNQEIMGLRNELDQTKISGDPIFKDVLDNYGDEVKRVQAELSQKGVRDALKQAVNQVSLGHMTEIIGRQVSAQQAQATADPGPQALRSPGVPNRAPQKKVVRLTSGEEAHRVQMGLSYDDYATLYKS